jgi:fatty-acyl-CoA synthase
VVPKAGAALSEKLVLDHAHGVLAGFKVPKRVILAESLPKNPSGKILKRQLREEHGAAFEHESATMRH